MAPSRSQPAQTVDDSQEHAEKTQRGTSTAKVAGTISKTRVAQTGIRRTRSLAEVIDVPVDRLSKSQAAFLQGVARELLLRDPDGSRMRRVSDPEAVARAAADYAVDTADTWTEHLGGFYDVDGVRTILSRGGKPVSKQAVSKRRGLLALTTGSGRVVYPSFQFDSGSTLPGLEAVLREVPEELVSRWTLASWLISAQAELDGEPPVRLLREGSVEPVVAAARGWADSLAA